jgi:3-carboxy-cis,cis-muconate cycloisomerase
MATAAALRHAQSLAVSLRPDPDRMASQLAEEGGAALSEAASFALAAHMPREAAQELVKGALAQARAAKCSLVEQLSQDPQVKDLEDWAVALDADHLLRPAQDMAVRVFAQRLHPNYKYGAARDR